MAKSKISIKVNGRWWDCVPMEGCRDSCDNRPAARLRLSDDRSDGGFNHPRVALNFNLRGCEHPEWTRNHCVIVLEFQRNVYRVDERDYWRPALGYMDTKTRWSRAYAGHVELSHDARQVKIVDQSFKLDDESALAVEVARRIARTAAEFKISGEDECQQAVEAIERMGLPVEKVYDLSYGRGNYPLDQVEGRGANAAAGESRMLRFWTNAPADYDYDGTVTIRADAKHDDGRAGRWVEIPEPRAASQCERYRSGLHVVFAPEEFYADCRAWRERSESAA